MTVIAYDGRFVAVDRQCTHGHVASAMTKLYPFGRRALAFCGDAGHGMQLVVWYKSGALPDTYPKNGDEKTNAYLYVFEEGRKVACYETSCIPFFVESVPFTAGSGQEAAKAALLMGASACAAVEIANQVNIHCGMGVDVIDLLELSERVPDADVGRSSPAEVGAAAAA